MPLLDLILFAGVVTAAYLGYKSGAARKLFTFLALLASILLAAHFMHPVASWLASIGLASGTSALVAGFILLLGACLLAAFLTLQRLGKTSLFKKGGKAAGAVLGVLEGLLIMSVLLWGLRVFDEPGSQLRNASHFYKPVLCIVPESFGFVKSFVPGAGEFRQLIDGATHPDATGRP